MTVYAIDYMEDDESDSCGGTFYPPLEQAITRGDLDKARRRAVKMLLCLCDLREDAEAIIEANNPTTEVTPEKEKVDDFFFSLCVCRSLWCVGPRAENNMRIVADVLPSLAAARTRPVRLLGDWYGSATCFLLLVARHSLWTVLRWKELDTLGLMWDEASGGCDSALARRTLEKSAQWATARAELQHWRFALSICERMAGLDEDKIEALINAEFYSAAVWRLSNGIPIAGVISEEDRNDPDRAGQSQFPTRRRRRARDYKKTETYDALACTALAANPGWTKDRIAKEIGCPPSYLSESARCPRFVSMWNEQTDNAKADLPNGVFLKDDDGPRMEAGH